MNGNVQVLTVSPDNRAGTSAIVAEVNSLATTSNVDISRLPHLVRQSTHQRNHRHVRTTAHRLDADLDIVIPVLNEERRIGRTVSEICRHLERSDLRCQVIVVDNGSVDDTLEALDSVVFGDTHLRVMSCAQRGKGAAVRAGVLASSARHVAYCDADLSTPLSALTSSIGLLNDGWQAILCSRRCHGSSYEVRQSVVRRVGSRVFNQVASSLVGPIRDTQCGFKVLDGEVARATFADLKIHGFAFDVELIARLIRSGVRIIELPVRWSHDDGSTFNMVSDGVGAFRDLYRVHCALRTTDKASHA